jgi:hypothetical protein
MALSQGQRLLKVVVPSYFTFLGDQSGILAGGNIVAVATLLLIDQHGEDPFMRAASR